MPMGMIPTVRISAFGRSRRSEMCMCPCRLSDCEPKSKLVTRSDGSMVGISIIRYAFVSKINVAVDRRETYVT